MPTHAPLRTLLFLLLLSIAAGPAAGGSQPADASTDALESVAKVYGPYRVIRLPITQGVKILNPIKISLGQDGRIYAANQTGEVYVLRDTNGDGLEDEAFLFCDVSRDGLHSPGGFASRGDTVYIGTRQEIRAYRDTDGDGRADTSRTFFKDIPHGAHPYEWTSGLSFGPDGWLYCALATDSWNSGASPDPKGYRGSLLRISPDGQTAERVATGLRSVWGMAFDPHGELFFNDNEGGGNPKEELNRLIRGRYYGHNPKKFPERDAAQPAVPAEFVLENEVAPAGMVFNAPANDFGGTGGDLFVAYYGPGERWSRGGVGRVRITRHDDGTYGYREFPVLDLPKLADLAFGPNGSLYLAQHGKSDYWYNSTQEKSGAFYKVVYDPTVTSWSTVKEKPAAPVLSANAIEVGADLFAQRACSACHGTMNGPELLGPNLNGIASRLTREEILEEIVEPNKRIKPGLAGVKFTMKNGQIVLGRVVNANDHQFTVQMMGNAVVPVTRSDIASTEQMTKSLMPEKMLNGLTPMEIDNLLSYLGSLR
jgi:putative heme-binding domain-containing protein